MTEAQMCKLLSEIGQNFTVFIQEGVIQPGSDADIVILDPSKEDVISASWMHIIQITTHLKALSLAVRLMTINRYHQWQRGN